MDTKSIQYKWIDSISEIDSNEWNELFSESVLKSHELFNSMQSAKMQHVNFKFIKIFDDKKTLLLAPCFTYQLQMDVLASNPVKALANKMRKLSPNFMTLKIFCVGSLVATCEQHIGIRKGLSTKELEKVKQIFNTQVKQKSDELKCSIVFIKEVPHHNLENIKSFLSEDFYFYDSLPNSYIPIGDICQPYPTALRRKERQRFKKDTAEFAKNYEWEIIEDFGSYSETAERLYLQVLEKSKNRFECVNNHFFKHVNEKLPSKSFLMIARDKQENILVIELVFEDEDKLIPMYLGIDYEKDSNRVLYSNTIFKTIDEAEKRGKSMVVLGQTSYYPKVLSGALVERLYLGFYSSGFILNFLIKKVFKYLFKPTPVNRNVYYRTKQAKVINSCSVKGIIVENK